MLYNGLTREEYIQKRREAFEILKPALEEFVNNYCCPHDLIIAEMGRVQLYSGEMGFSMQIPD